MTCGACGGTGKNSKGGTCTPCWIRRQRGESPSDWSETKDPSLIIRMWMLGYNWVQCATFNNIESWTHSSAYIYIYPETPNIKCRWEMREHLTNKVLQTGFGNEVPK